MRALSVLNISTCDSQEAGAIDLGMLWCRGVVSEDVSPKPVLCMKRAMGSFSEG